MSPEYLVAKKGLLMLAGSEEFPGGLSWRPLLVGGLRETREFLRQHPHPDVTCCLERTQARIKNVRFTALIRLFTR